MFDERERKLAHTLINYSCELKRGESILIEHSNVTNGFLQCLANEVFDVGGFPFFREINRQLQEIILSRGGEKLFTKMATHDAALMNDMDAVILVRGDNNSFEYSAVPPKNVSDYNVCYNGPVHIERRLNKKWVTLRFPTQAFAQHAKVSTRAFEDYYFKVCNLDYSKMCKAMEPLKALMENTDKVKIVTPNTNLEFSIKNIPAVKCCGERNIPDGELYTAPVKDSVNGTICFNVPALFNGVLHQNICLGFENGRVVRASSNNTPDLRNIINTDEGSCFVGEFSFGLNPFITSIVNDILFDEKMCFQFILRLEIPMTTRLTATKVAFTGI